MKNIFGINITEDKNNLTFDGQAFVQRTASPELDVVMDAAEKLVEDLIKKAKLPLWLRIIKFISLLFAVIIITGIIRADGISPAAIAQAYRDVPYFFYAAAISLIIWLALFIAGKIKQRNVAESDDFGHAVDCTDSAANKLLEEFNIPQDAKNVDILIFKYKIKKGKVKITNSASDTWFLNAPCTVYSQDDALHIALLRQVLTIPLQSIHGIIKINKKIFANGWNKETPSNKGEFKKYKIGFNGTNIFFKPYYDIIIKHGEDDYCISIPPYELETMSELIGIRFEE